MKALVFVLATISSSGWAHQLWNGHGAPSSRSGCSAQNKAKALKWMENLAPEAYRVYQADPNGFMDPVWWTDCNTHLVDAVVVALHETIHGLSLNNHYPLLNGASEPYFNDRGMFAPALVRAQFQRDRFVEIYLSTANDAATSGKQFSFLLDEFNAYTHGLNLENKLTVHVNNRQWRSGAVAMMGYVLAYVKRAKERHSGSWTRLNSARSKQTLRALWRQAEMTVAASCQLAPPLDREDRQYLRKLCDPAQTSALSEVLGYSVSCPSRCL